MSEAAQDFFLQEPCPQQKKKKKMKRAAASLHVDFAVTWAKTKHTPFKVF